MTTLSSKSDIFQPLALYDKNPSPHSYQCLLKTRSMHVTAELASTQLQPCQIQYWYPASTLCCLIGVIIIIIIEELVVIVCSGITAIFIPIRTV